MGNFITTLYATRIVLIAKCNTFKLYLSTYSLFSVQYDVEYKYPHKTPGFDVDDMLAEENEVIIR